MGVKGLWSIVSPAGIRVNPEIFTGKRIAIDVSIWLYELTYANNFKVIKNYTFDNLSIFNDLWMDFSQNINNEIRIDSLKKAHLYFFFLRICKLLYYNIRPIFVFDGNPPDLKKKTIFQRNLKKRNYEEKFKKTAEKLIYNYYQGTLLKSLKNKKNILNKKKDKEKDDLHKKKISNTSKNNSLKIGGILDNDTSLNNIVEKIGSVTVSLKDVLNFCNDDLHKIENNMLMITNRNTIIENNNENEGLDQDKLINDKKEEKSISFTNKRDDISKHYEICDEDGYNENELIEDDKEKSIIEHNNINSLEKEINEEIVRKKHISRKKYYESIPQNFKGFLSMRRPVGIIDISNYNMDILEYTKKLKAEEKYNKIYAENILLNNDVNSLYHNLVSADEKENNFILDNKDNYNGDNNPNINNSQNVEYISSSNDDFFLLENKKNRVHKTDDKENENNTTYEVDVNKKDINILELPSNFNSSDIFLDGKDEYKVYYVNNEEIKIPLFKEINKDVFEKLPIKLQYQILQDIKEEWYADNRIKAIKSKDDMDIFSEVQLETYVRMIKTDFEIEKLKIKMAENIQNVEGELIINKELSKSLENLNIRDYNDIKKKKKRRKKYLNEILNNCYYNSKENPFDLIIKNEEENEAENEAEKVKSNKIKDDDYDNIEAFENVEIKNKKINNVKLEEKEMLIKMEDDFKKDLLMSDKQIFGDNFFDAESENKNREINTNNELDSIKGKYKQKIDFIQIESSDEYETIKRNSVSHLEKNANLMEMANINIKYKNNYENDDIKSKLQNVEQNRDEKNNFSSSDDFENCSIEEKEDIDEFSPTNKYVEIDLINNFELFEEHKKKCDDNLIVCVPNELMNDTNINVPPNDKIFIKTNKLENINMEKEPHINMKGFKANGISNDQQKINEDINFLENKKELNKSNPYRLNRESKIKESLINEMCHDGLNYLKENKNIEEDINIHFSLDENKNRSIDGDKNVLNNEDKNILIDEDKNILINEDKNILINEDKNILINEDENILIDENKNRSIDEDKNILINEDKNILINEDKNILINEDKNILIDENKNRSIDEDKNILINEDGNILIDENKNRSIDEDKNILINEDKNILINEDKNISYDENKNSANEIKKKENITKFMSKQKINDIMLNKCDLNNIGKENFFENLLNNKEIMDKFNAEIKEKEKLKEDKNDEYAYYEYLEDNKVIDSYINETNKENDQLIKEFKKLKKNNIEINDEMNDDIKILLDFFGIPYVQSPCEAEAQCSYLNSQNYCDAIISDDSDVLVFNGKTVIKNFFNRKKTVEVYEKKIIEDKLGLYQEELINISLLCGCDYTTGVHGIGIVNALEIIKAFPTFEDLKILKDIVSNPFREINSDNYSEEIKNFLHTHKNYKLNWIFPNNFPDKEVYNCFKYPKVCTNIKKFQWNFPNINSISSFLNKTTNIPKEKVFNVLNPILQKYDVKVRSYQLKIEDFFPIIEKKRKNINDLIDVVRKNKKSKKKSNENLELDKNISSLIDVNPVGIIKSMRMTTALDYIKKRKSKKKK